jgi:hypothetical protein
MVVISGAGLRAFSLTSEKKALREQLLVYHATHPPVHCSMEGGRRIVY